MSGPATSAVAATVASAATAATAAAAASSSPAAAVPLSRSLLLATARRLTLPLFATSLSIGGSMFAGDVICQWIVVRAQRAKIMEEHAEKQRQAHNAAAAVAAPPAPIPPLDFDRLLAYRSPADAPPARLPSLPSSWLAAAPSWWNPNRSLAMATSGFCFGGPWSFTLMRVGEHIFPGKTVAAIVKKMSINISLAPLSISTTFYLTNYFQGRSDAEAFARIRNDMPSTFMSAGMYWPFVSFLNLRFVSLAWRPVVAAGAGSIWNIYISSKANSTVAPPAAAPASSATASAAAGTLEGAAALAPATNHVRDNTETRAAAQQAP